MKLRLKFVAQCCRREDRDLQRRLLFNPHTPGEAAPSLWVWPTSRRKGRPRQTWIDQAMTEVRDMATAERCAPSELLSEMRDHQFCKVVFGRSRGAARALEAQDTLNE